MDGTKTINDQELDSAISGAIFEIVNQETNIFSAGFTVKILKYFSESLRS